MPMGECGVVEGSETGVGGGNVTTSGGGGSLSCDSREWLLLGSSVIMIGGDLFLPSGKLPFNAWSMLPIPTPIPSAPPPAILILRILAPLPPAGGVLGGRVASDGGGALAPPPDSLLGLGGSDSSGSREPSGMGTNSPEARIPGSAASKVGSCAFVSLVAFLKSDTKDSRSF